MNLRLGQLLVAQLARGAVQSTTRRQVADWAACLGAAAGAAYLQEILTYKHNKGQSERPVPPWKTEKPLCVDL